MKRINIFDIILIVASVLGAIVLSPFVIRQFAGLRKTGDIIWNVSYDLLLLSGVVLIVVFLSKLLRKFNRWS